MCVRMWSLIAAALLLAATVSACSNNDGGTQIEGIAPGMTEAAPATIAPGGDTVSDAVGMVGSGQATLPPQPEVIDPVRPTIAAGIQRAVSLQEARDKLPFALMVPQILPEETYLQIIQLIEAAEGETAPGLPAARLIYDVDARGVIVLYQAPAGGDLPPGDSVTIAGLPGTVSEIPNGFLFAWESDGVRYELRGSGLDRETLLSVAESLAPSSDGSEGGASTEDVGEAPTEAPAGGSGG